MTRSLLPLYYRAAREAFSGFDEMSLSFNPTFKFDVGTDVYVY